MTKNLVKPLLLVLSTTALFLLPPQAPCKDLPAKTNSAVVLIQQHWTMGRNKIIIGENGLHIITADGLNLTAQAPDWTVVCYRPAEKLVWQSALKNFSGIAHFQDQEETVRARDNLLTAKHFNYLGLDCHKYSTLSRMSNYTVTTNKFNIPKEAAAVLCRYYAMPAVTELPLFRCERYFLNAKELAQTRQGKDSFLTIKEVHEGPVQFLQTLSIKTMFVSPAEFRPPPGFKSVVDSEQLLLSTKQQSQITDIMSEIGFSTQVGRH